MAPATKDLVMSMPMEDVQLPSKAVERIIKSGLPSGFRMEKDAMSGVVRAATVFVSYLAATAQEAASDFYIFKLAPIPLASGEPVGSAPARPYKTAKHKAITAQDIFHALDLLSLRSQGTSSAPTGTDYEVEMRRELSAHYELIRRRKSNAAANASVRRKAQKEQVEAQADGDDDEEDQEADAADGADNETDFAVVIENEGQHESHDGRPAKKPREESLAINPPRRPIPSRDPPEEDENSESEGGEETETQDEPRPLPPSLLVQAALHKELEGDKMEDPVVAGDPDEDS